jgi:hypothetical protein
MRIRTVAMLTAASAGVLRAEGVTGIRLPVAHAQTTTIDGDTIPGRAECPAPLPHRPARPDPSALGVWLAPAYVYALRNDWCLGGARFQKPRP